MTEARFLLNKTQEELKDKQREVSSLEKDVNIIKERTSEDKLREEAKVGVVHGLEDKLRELEEKCQKQELTVIDAGKLIAETKDLSNEARTVIQHISEAQNKIAELERLLTKESQAAQRLEKEWKERASSLEMET
jgi:dihydrofolate reductase